ncbi:hypothetical protein AAVH_03230 [Aphelenchoides avenae]|nr:hypothetical protein AAVH_03230 [Aphelenchus avenae]
MSLAIGKFSAVSTWRTRKPKKLEESAVEVSQAVKVAPTSSKKEGGGAIKEGQKIAAGMPIASNDVDKHESLVTAEGRTPRTRTEDQKPMEQNPEETKKRARSAVQRFLKRRERDRAKLSVPASKSRLQADERTTAERPTRKANAGFVWSCKDWTSAELECRESYSVRVNASTRYYTK